VHTAATSLDLNGRVPTSFRRWTGFDNGSDQVLQDLTWWVSDAPFPDHCIAPEVCDISAIQSQSQFTVAALISKTSGSVEETCTGIESAHGTWAMSEEEHRPCQMVPTGATRRCTTPVPMLRRTTVVVVVPCTVTVGAGQFRRLPERLREVDILGQLCGKQVRFGEDRHVPFAG
jgi:hypothetical protein